MAEKFTQHTGTVVPLDAANVDTDAIIPKQFCRRSPAPALARTCLTTGAFSTIRSTAEPGVRAEFS